MRRLIGNCRCSRERISRFGIRERRRLQFVTRRILDPNLPIQLLKHDKRVDVETMDEVLAYWRNKLESIQELKARLNTPHAVLEITR